MKRSSPFVAHLPLLLVFCLLVACTGWWYLSSDDTNSSAPRSSQATSVTPKSGSPTVDDASAELAFRKWMSQPDGKVQSAATRKDWDEQAIAAGVALAQDRRQRMARLIRENPRQALKESLSFAEWAELPAAVQAHVEKPFTLVADYGFYPVCGNGTPLPLGTLTYVAELSLSDGTQLETYAYGARIDHMSKRNLPVQGISLDGVAAVREETLQRISTADLAALRAQQPDMKEIAGQGSILAVAGGRVYAFESEQDFDNANARLSAADARPGPIAATSYLLPSGDGEINWDEIETFANTQASAWTETKKKVFLIRAIFPDNATDPVSQADASNVMNGIVSDTIRSMSYQKTWIEATVSANLYTVEQNTTYYQNGGGSALNAELLRHARNAFRNNKSGADASINIGPVSNTGNGDSGGLGDYNIVGVTFTNLGLKSGTVTYAGLAGGGNLWMQGDNSPVVFIHEFGHNYGLQHASSWDVTSSNPVDPAGTSTEYGDIYDIMGSGEVPMGHFHVQAKQKIDWLTSSQWKDATSLGSNTYRIYRIDDGATTTANNRGVRITKGTSPADYYWLSYRPGYTNSETQVNGVYLNWQRSGETKCWMLDTTPGSAAGKKDSAITLGRTYSDPTAQVHITTLGTGGTGADQWVDVRVNIGPFAGNTAPNAQAIAGVSTLPARNVSTFTSNATDPDGDPVSFYWDTKDSAVNQNASSLSKSWTVGGTYALDLTVSDMKGGTTTITKSVTVTDPLDSWTTQSSGNTGYLRAATWGKGRFVVAELFGTVLNSWDGVTWTNVGELPDFDRDPMLAFGNNTFVAAGKINNASAAQICYSPDGRTWNVANFPAGIPQVRQVIFANGRFLASCANGNLLSSTDGITWTLNVIAGAPDFRFLAWNGSVWIGVGYRADVDRTDTIWTSTDAVNWSQQNNVDFIVYGIQAHNNVVYLLGWYGGIAYTTDNGVSWKDASTPGDSRWSTRLMTVAPDGTMVVTAKAMDEPDTPQAFLVSTDGVHWARSSAGATYAYDVRSLTFGFGRFLATSDGGVVRTSGAWYPGNTAPTASFTAAPSSMPARENRLFAAAASDADGDALTYAWDFGMPNLISDAPSLVKSFDFGGSATATLRVSDGRGGMTVLTKNITVTDAARTWTQRSSGTTNTLHAITTNGSIAVAVGGGGGVIRTSTDGITWTTRTISGPDSSTNIHFRSACWDGTRFVIVGSDYKFTAPAGWQGCIYTSPDGITWTRRYGTTERGNELFAVATSGDAFVAVGLNGTVVQSTDSINWTPVSLPEAASSSLRGCAYGAGTWVINGHSSAGSGTPILFTSTDRTNWMNQTSIMGIDSWMDFRRIAYLNNRFIGSGWYSRVRTSTDLTAFTTTRSDFEETPGLAYGDNMYFAAGVNRSNSSADIDLLSLDGITWSSAPAPTTDDRNGAVFFKHTFITVGAAGSIWQSGDVTPNSAGSNQPPQFAGYSLQTPHQTRATLSLGKMMSAASDPDGDARYCTAVAASSAQGGSVLLGQGSIQYTPANGFAGTDSFQVTITDARGASTTGTVQVTVLSDVGIGSNAPKLTMLPGGQVGISFQGIPGRSYEIQRSTDLENWSVLSTVTATNTGAILFTDPSPPPGSAFYRIRKP